jgi:hypothetical protein
VRKLPDWGYGVLVLVIAFLVCVGLVLIENELVRANTPMFYRGPLPTPVLFITPTPTRTLHPTERTAAVDAVDFDK